jgi:hypothetical protein
VHNYDDFITTFISMLAQQSHLADLLENGLNPQKKKTNGNAATPDLTSNSGKKASANAKVLAQKQKEQQQQRRGRQKRRK